MQFDKRLWLARWAGDEAYARVFAERLGLKAAEEGDGLLQENLFEAELAATAAHELAENTFGAALTAVKDLTDRRIGIGSNKSRSARFLHEAAKRVRGRLEQLERQLKFRERESRELVVTALGSPGPRARTTELFVEKRRESQRSGRIGGARFWRITYHPDGREVRSYLPTRSWVNSGELRQRLIKQGFGEVVDGQRSVVFQAMGEQFVLYSDGRIHSIARTMDEKDIIPVLKSIADPVDGLWEVSSQLHHE